MRQMEDFMLNWFRTADTKIFDIDGMNEKNTH